MEKIPQTLIESFRPPAFPGSYFLSIEGIEGCGKSTQIINIKNFLEEKGFRVIILREPGGTTFGERLRQAVLESKNMLHPIAEALLFAASRAQLLHEVIMKELSTPSSIVICDRYIDSSLVYQGTGRGLGHQTILNIHNHFPLNLVPHLTIYLKIGLKTSRSRVESRNRPKDYFESQADSFFEKLIKGYDQIAANFPERIKVIDGEIAQNEVFEKIRPHLQSLITD